MEQGELTGWLRLALTDGIGNQTARRLLTAFGLPQAVFQQPRSALTSVVGPAQASALLTEPSALPAQLDATLQWLGQSDATSQHRILTLGDAGYPPALLEIEDPPLMLYLMGQRCGDWPVAIAVVGSRNPTPQGLVNARQFGKAFGQAGLSVVSGLALGVDGAAHEGALEGAAPDQLATLAVVGTGLDRVYPRRHLGLAHRIAKRGLLLSEYPIGTSPLASNFPRRNRLIAALSQGTLVVEAALQSGSLITARLAAEQGREVFAIPGSIHSTQSRGCHWLIKQGAKLVESAQDVLEELRMAPAASPHVDQADGQEGPARCDRADPILEALGFEPSSLDALVARTGTAPCALQAGLLELELQGQVARLPGGLFQRIERG